MACGRAGGGRWPGVRALAPSGLAVKGMRVSQARRRGSRLVVLHLARRAAQRNVMITFRVMIRAAPRFLWGPTQFILGRTNNRINS